jgi:hypothetical protein
MINQNPLIKNISYRSYKVVEILSFSLSSLLISAEEGIKKMKGVLKFLSLLMLVNALHGYVSYKK